jgi:glucose-6-phosphate dehydrogenase assembly protein OpcA
MIEVTADDIRYFKQLDERQRRLYLGLQAKKIGWRGVSTLSAAYNVDVKTIRKGKSELSDLPDTPVKRIRKVGGGPKKKS